MEGTFPDRSGSLIQDLDADGSRFGPSANLGNQASELDGRIGSAPTGWRKIFGDFAATAPGVSAA